MKKKDYNTDWITNRPAVSKISVSLKFSTFTKKWHIFVRISLSSWKHNIRRNDTQVFLLKLSAELQLYFLN